MVDGTLARVGCQYLLLLWKTKPPKQQGNNITDLVRRIYWRSVWLHLYAHIEHEIKNFGKGCMILGCYWRSYQKPQKVIAKQLFWVLTPKRNIRIIVNTLPRNGRNISYFKATHNNRTLRHLAVSEEMPTSWYQRQLLIEAWEEQFWYEIVSIILSRKRICMIFFFVQFIPFP